MTLFVLAEKWHGDPEVREPHKCARWEWFDWHALPEPLFLPLKNLTKQGFTPSAEGC